MSRAKDAYEKFQDAMGNWERTPFEHLCDRETAAWHKLGSLDEIGIDALEEAQRSARANSKKVGRLEDEKQALERRVETLEEVNDALRGQIYAFDEKFQAITKAISKLQKAKKVGKR